MIGEKPNQQPDHGPSDNQNQFPIGRERLVSDRQMLLYSQSGPCPRKGAKCVGSIRRKQSHEGGAGGKGPIWGDHCQQYGNEKGAWQGHGRQKRAPEGLCRVPRDLGRRQTSDQPQEQRHGCGN